MNESENITEAGKVKLYPPGGGEPVEVFPQSVARMTAAGWTEDESGEPADMTPDDEPVADDTAGDGNNETGDE